MKKQSYIFTILIVLLSLSSMAQLKADFDIPENPICIGEKATAVAHSPTAKTYYWQWGEHPFVHVTSDSFSDHTFFNAGTYIVKLVVEDSLGNLDSTEHTIRVLDVPNANFSLNQYPNSQGYYCVGTEFSISPWSNISGFDSLHWDFGDGYTSNDRYPYHSYKDAGNYNIILSLSGKCGTDNFANGVKIADDVKAKPELDMYLSSDTYCPGSQVDLSVSLYDEKLSYFILHTGDGKSTGLDEFSYVYSDTGEYTIMAIGENSCGIDTFTTKINIGNDMDNRPFIYSRNVTCVGRASELFLGSQNESFASATVDFGDSTQIDTIWDMTTPFFHSYKKGGSYTVSAIFTYTNFAQPDTITTKVTVLARPNVFPFSVYVSSTNLCPKEEVNINGPSISGGDTLIYDLGDGTFLKFADERPNLTHSYNSTGTYEIKIHRITVCDTFYNRDSASITVTVSDNLKTNLYLSANYSTKELLSCVGDSFTLRMENSQHPFTNPTFTLPDGSKVSGEALTTAFDQVGTYPIIASATNYCGVEMKSAYTVELTDKTMNPSLSGYSYPRAQCINQLFLFDMFTENATNMLWEFGDGNWIENPEGPHVQHLYTEPGTYTVKVTASNGCGETIKNTTLFVEPGPKVDFTAKKKKYLKGKV